MVPTWCSKWNFLVYLLDRNRRYFVRDPDNGQSLEVVTGDSRG